MNKVAIYARKSTESEDRQVLSIESQVKELRDYANRMKWQVVRVFSESKSAKGPGRQVFNELYQSMQNGSITEVLCWKLDRLARNPIDGGALIWAMEENKLKQIHTPHRSFSNTGNDKFWLQLEFGMAKKYVDDLRDNVMRGMKTKVEKGWYPYKAPLGYLNDRETKTIVPDPERFRLVRAIWDLMLTGSYTPPEVLKVITDKYGLRNVQHKSGGGHPLTRSHIYKILHNPFYHGIFRYLGKTYQGKHKPMITREEFLRVQAIMNRGFTTRPKRYEFTFTGLIKCGECGAAITAEHRMNKRYGQKYIYYHCTKRLRLKERKCRQKYIQEPKLTAQIVAFIDTLSIDREIVAIALGILDRDQISLKAKNEAIVTSLQKRLRQAKQEQSELLTIKLRKLINDEDFLTRNDELKSEIQSLETQLSKIRKDPNYANKRTMESFELVSAIKSKFLQGTFKDKRTILNQVGSNLTLTDRKLLIQAKQPFNHFQEFNISLKAEKQRFEPRIRALDNTKSADVTGGLEGIQSLVNNVRTYFTRMGGFPQESGGCADYMP